MGLANAFYFLAGAAFVVALGGVHWLAWPITGLLLLLAYLAGFEE